MSAARVWRACLPVLAGGCFALPFAHGFPGLLALAGFIPLLSFCRAVNWRMGLLGGCVCGGVWTVASVGWLPAGLVHMAGASPWVAWSLLAPLMAVYALPLGAVAGIAAALGSRPARIRIPLTVMAAGAVTESMPLPVPVHALAGLHADDALRQLFALGAQSIPVMVSVLFACLVIERTRVTRAAALAVIVAAYAHGFWRLNLTDAAPRMRIAVIQPNLSPTRDDEASARHVDALVRQSEQFLKRPDTQAALMVWPEVPVGLSLTDRPGDREAVTALATRTRTPLLVNGHSLMEGTPYYHNSTWLVLPDGTLHRYDKQILVPFGEALPETLASWAHLLPDVKAYRPGPYRTPMPLGHLRLATPVCFEALFPAALREWAGDTAIIINPGDDLWFYNPTAQTVHLALARLRAVELDRPILRVFNSGITALIDRFGRLDPITGAPDGYLEHVYEVPLHTGFQSTPPS